MTNEIDHPRKKNSLISRIEYMGKAYDELANGQNWKSL
jgi:hypothetical protein